MKFRFPIVIIDEDYRAENTSGFGIRALAAAIEAEGFEVAGATSYGDLSQFAQQQSRASAFILSIDDEELGGDPESAPAVQDLRNLGIKAGLFRPITVWPFPVVQLAQHLPHVKQIVMVEASNGQLEDEVRLALSNHGCQKLPPFTSIRRFGGMLPQQTDVVAHIQATLAKEVR